MSDPKCKACGGTGHLLSDRSWFIQDGYTRKECYYCSSPTTTYPIETLAKRQRRKRERVAKWGGLTPKPEMLDPRGVCLPEFA